MWKIEKIISKGDYDYCIVRNHPNRTKNDYVLYHRIIMENHLGRLLNSNEVVHHIDGNKKNNVIDNLSVMTAKEHGALHHEHDLSKHVQLKCPVCGKIFERPYRQTHFSKRNSNCTTCSRSCGGFLGRMKQLNRLTVGMKRAITKNVLAVYYKYSRR